MVVDAVIRHWLTLSTGEEYRQDGFGRAVQWITVLFYADDGLLDSPRPSHLQADLDVLTDLFEMVLLHTNANKMARMVCQTC